MVDGGYLSDRLGAVQDSPNDRLIKRGWESRDKVQGCCWYLRYGEH